MSDSRTALRIEEFSPSGECDYSQKTGEVVRVSSEDGTIQNAWLSFAELQRLIKFRHRQSQQGSDAPPASSHCVVPRDP